MSAPAPLHTVIVPCYNGAPTLDETLASARAQTAVALEILVVDDGSTDGSAAIAHRHAAADPRVRVLGQENRGVGAARNLGLAAARGAFVSFLDADDLLEPDKLARQGAVLEGNPGVGLVICDGCVIDAAGAVTWPSLVALRRFAGHPSLLSVCLQGGPFPPLVPLVRTALARQVGGFDEDRAAAGWADVGFWLRLAAAGLDYYVLPDRLVRYRVTTSSMSADVEAMDAAADLVYARFLERHPHLAARALRTVRQRVLDLECASDDLRTVAATLAGAARPELRAAPAAAEDGGGETLLRALARGSVGVTRPLWIWGAGSAGRHVHAQVLAAGGVVAAFVDSDPARTGQRCAGVPIVAPDDLARAAARPFVLVASMHAAAIADVLTAIGWQPAIDFHVAPAPAASPERIGEVAA